MDEEGYFDTYKEWHYQFKIEEAEYLKKRSQEQKELWFAYRKGVLGYEEAVRLIDSYRLRERSESISCGYNEWLTENTKTVLDRVPLEYYVKNKTKH